MGARSCWIAIGTLVLAACSEQGSSAASQSAAAAPPAAPAGIPESASIFVGCGHLLVENHGATAFTVLLKGEHVHPLPMEDRNAWVLDDDVLTEITTAKARDVGAPAARGAELLRRYMEWETAFTARQNGWPPVRPGVGLVDEETGDAPVMTWGYDAPTPLTVFDQTVSRVMYATAAVDSVVFVMSMPLRERDDPARVSQTALAALVTLSRSAEPIDPNALSARVQATPPPWPGCSG